MYYAIGLICDTELSVNSVITKHHQHYTCRTSFANLAITTIVMILLYILTKYPNYGN